MQEFKATGKRLYPWNSHSSSHFVPNLKKFLFLWNLQIFWSFTSTFRHEFPTVFSQILNSLQENVHGWLTYQRFTQDMLIWAFNLGLITFTFVHLNPVGSKLSVVDEKNQDIWVWVELYHLYLRQISYFLATFVTATSSGPCHTSSNRIPVKTNDSGMFRASDKTFLHVKDL